MNKRYMKSALLFATVVVSIVLVVAFVRNKPVAVNVTTAEQNVEVEVYGLGTVEAKILSRIGFEVGAAITELNADQGDKVKKGAVLARLHSAEQEAKTALAAAAVKSAESRLKKAQAAIPKLQSTLEFHKI
ncbi:biotin/lipoyl-binding protein, partial [Nitrosomonas sp.]|uniref:biotin/lipoyl-binding protein n=1 Tax=Nitrosomonas sp. TaxID=42353 RepID=UPI001D1DA04C